MKKARLFLFIPLLLLAFLPLSGRAAAQVGTSISVAPSLTAVAPGEQFTVEVWVRDVADLYGFDVTLNYDPAYLTYDSVAMGNFLDLGSSVNCDLLSTGVVQCNNAQINPSESKYGDGILFWVTFTANHEDAYTYLTVNNCTDLSDRDGFLIPYTVQNGDVQIGDAEPPSEESHIYIPLFIR